MSGRGGGGQNLHGNRTSLQVAVGILMGVASTQTPGGNDGTGPPELSRNYFSRYNSIKCGSRHSGGVALRDLIYVLGPWCRRPAIQHSLCTEAAVCKPSSVVGRGPACGM